MNPLSQSVDLEGFASLVESGDIYRLCRSLLRRRRDRSQRGREDASVRCEDVCGRGAVARQAQELALSAADALAESWAIASERCAEWGECEPLSVAVEAVRSIERRRRTEQERGERGLPDTLPDRDTSGRAAEALGRCWSIRPAASVAWGMTVAYGDGSLHLARHERRKHADALATAPPIRALLAEELGGIRCGWRGNRLVYASLG